MQKGIFFPMIIFASSLVLSGCSFVPGDKNPESSDGISKSNDVSASCRNQYQAVIDYNKADFEDCSVGARTGNFEEKKVEKKQINMIIIFDSSGSMAQKIDGRMKIDIAKEAAKKYIDQLSGDEALNLGMLVYGHKGSNSTSHKKISCEGIEEIYYMNKIYPSVAKSKIDSFGATGWTPIAQSLEKAAQMLAPYADAEKYINTILLISDGKETCDGDPVAVAKKLNDSGLHVTANVIGFDVGGADERELQRIAENGGGEYFSVKIGADFDFAFQKHKAFMEKFDYQVGRLTEQLDDMISIGDKYFVCLMRLKKEEGLVMLDIYADKLVAPECAADAEKLYYERHDAIFKDLNEKYEGGKKQWREESAKLIK